MVDAKEVNRIWKALRVAKLCLLELGPVRISTSKIVDFMVDEASKALASDGGPAIPRERILEAWLYEVLEMLAAARGVEPLPKVD